MADKKHNIMLDDLTQMVQRGFVETATKEMVQELPRFVDERFGAVHNHIRDLKSRVQRLEQYLKLKA